MDSKHESKLTPIDEKWAPEEVIVDDYARFFKTPFDYEVFSKLPISNQAKKEFIHKLSLESKNDGVDLSK